jgi:glycosyltransferase involved in cell wall biosynthesis
MMSTREQKRFSVVTICHNSAATIAKTMESILSQNFAGLEYIVIDGASTDGTQDVVSSFAHLTDIFVSEPDRGIADAFNKGINAASGSIVGLVNSDDTLLPGTLERVWKYFQENPDVEVVHGDVLWYEGDHFIKRVKPTGRWWYPWRMVLFNHPATFVRRVVYVRHGLFSLDYRLAMDDDLFLKWTKKGVNIRYLPEPLVRMQAGGASGRYAFKVFGEKRRALLRNGFPRILTEIQFVTRCAGQFLVLLQQVGRRLAYK